MRKLWVLALGLLVLGCWTQQSRAADRADGPAASADPSADITDVYAWMSPDANRAYLVMDVAGSAGSAPRFSDSVQYTFHTHSHPAFGGDVSAEVDIVCTFDSAQKIQCWAGDESYVTGDASNPSGITSADGKLRVFAGLREDPFFINLRGFREAARTLAAAAGTLTLDAAGCPALDAATATALVTQLHTAPGGGPATDDSAGYNVLAIAVVVDKSVVTKSGPIVGVWGSTNRGAAAMSSCQDALGSCQGDLNGDGQVTIDEVIAALNNALKGCQAPVPPTLSDVQIDRMGRAGVNSMLTNPFYRESNPGEQANHDALQDQYNSATNPAEWGVDVATEIASNLPIFDALDRHCGNQLLADASATPERYSTLATLLADDQLYLNTNSGTCQQYLAVEVNAAGMTNSDCGGRTPLEDAIGTTYSVLVTGALSGVSDGVPVDSDGHPSLTNFPFLDQPH